MTTNATVWEELGQALARVEFLTNRLLEIQMITDDELVENVCVNALAVIAETESPNVEDEIIARVEAAEQRLTENKIDQQLESRHDESQ